MKYLTSLLTCLFLSCTVSANSELSQKEIQKIAEDFIHAKSARQQPGTTLEDIDYFISFLSDEFVDEHIKFKVVVTDKQTLRKGMIEKLKDEIFFSKIKIEQVMVGRNVVFIKYTEHAKVKPSHMDRIVEYTSTNIMSLEFNDKGLIKHIRRHHS